MRKGNNLESLAGGTAMAQSIQGCKGLCQILRRMPKDGKTFQEGRVTSAPGSCIAASR